MLCAEKDALGSAMNQGFFEFQLRSEDRTFVASVEVASSNLEESEARMTVAQLWELYFGAPEVITPGSVRCVNLKPIEKKPAGALKVAKGNIPLLFWKSEET